MKGLCIVMIKDLGFDVELKNGAISGFQNNLKDFFADEFIDIAHNIHAICQKNIGPSDGNDFLVKAFSVGVDDVHQGSIQKKLQECIKTPPLNITEVEVLEVFFTTLEEEVLNNLGKKIYVTDKWIDQYRDKQKNNIHISAMQIHAANGVVHGLDILVKYMRDQHKILFSIIFDVLAKLKAHYHEGT